MNRLATLESHLKKPVFRCRDETAVGHQGVLICYRVVEPVGATQNLSPVVVIRGLGMTKDDSVRLAEGLAATGRKVITLDNRGSGESEKPGFHFELADMAKDCVEVMKKEQNQTSKRFHLVGVSMGGCIAMKVALFASDMLASLTLGCTYAESRYNLEVPKRYREMAMQPIPQDPAERGIYMRELFGFSFTEDWIAAHPKAFQELLDQYEESEVKRMGTNTDPASAKSQEAALLNFLEVGMLHQVPHITTPTMVITGDRDRIIPYSHSLSLRASIPGSSLAILPRQGHLFWEMDPASTFVHLEKHFSMFEG
eukprot:TRINITY_DN17762_c0_g1_i1.p1 TRINITY_DN17762_c0_g1~~TRINITY_DN17762_c0_g1_i1.p1  ORF type:complete len:323 (+),score=36.36 TRINITY_DN17762_c0_g1_i1:38-970(+)